MTEPQREQSLPMGEFFSLHLGQVLTLSFVSSSVI